MARPSSMDAVSSNSNSKSSKKSRASQRWHYEPEPTLPITSIANTELDVFLKRKRTSRSISGEDGGHEEVREERGEKEEEDVQSKRRSTRHSCGVFSTYDLAKLAVTEVHGTRKALQRRMTKSAAIDGNDGDWEHDFDGSRAVSGSTLVGDEEANLWRGSKREGDEFSEESLVGVTSSSGKLQNDRRSSRLSLFTKAVEKAATVLGKRTREVLGTGKKTLQSLAAEAKAVERNRNHSLRDRQGTGAGHEEKTDDEEELPKRKKSRQSVENPPGLLVSSSEGHISARKPPTKVKKWLQSGLYAGQDQATDSASGLKRHRRKSTANPRIAKGVNATLPLPVFAGGRLLQTGRDFKLPFDLFCPLPPGQPKPEEWRKTQTNRFIGDAIGEWKRVKPLPPSKCVCTPSRGCDEHCFNRFMLYECDDSNCAIGRPLCTNRAFGDLKERLKKGNRYDVGVEVTKTVDRGYGVRSARTFEPGQIIVEYAGEIITQEECERRMRNEYKSNDCYYLMTFDQNMIIDATRGSIARFVNHSCEPNCRMVKWTVSGKPRMALFAGENGIMTGEELTYDYKFDPFSQKNVQTCRCGTASCRGVLGPRGGRDGGAGKKSFRPSVVGDKRRGGAAKRTVMGAKRKIGQVLGRVWEGTNVRDRFVKKRRLLTTTAIESNTERGKGSTAKKTIKKHKHVQRPKRSKTEASTRSSSPSSSRTLVGNRDSSSPPSSYETAPTEDEDGPATAGKADRR